MVQPRPGAPEHTRRWETDVVLRDGGVAHLRPIVPADATALQAFHVAQSPRSTYQRFFTDLPRLSPRDLARFTSVDHRDRVALVAEVAGALIGVGRYERLAGEGGAPGAVAEVALNVADVHQGRGVGSVLLEHLAAAADEQGVARFRAVVLQENTRMLDVFAAAGHTTTAHADDGLVALEMDVSATPHALAVIAARQAHAEAASLRALLRPTSVVVFGASRSGTGVGAHLLSHLVSAAFTGDLAVVHPERGELQGVTAFPALGRVPFVPDLAVVAVPAAAVPGVVGDCAARGVRAVVVVSAGFAETDGRDGTARQGELVATTRSHGMRLLGPASFGVLSTDAAVRLNASMAPRLPQPGRLALFSQSGALGVAVLDAARRRRQGISSMVSAGNRADVSGTDCLHYWSTDPETSVVGMYLESIGNPRAFTRAARALTRHKPVVVVSSGLSGASVPPGHRPLRTSAPPEALDAVLRQAGVVRVSTVHQLFDVAALLVHQPLPAGERLAVVGNSTALARLATEAALSWRLQVAPGRTLAPGAEHEEVVDALVLALGDTGVDAVLVCFVPSLDDPDLPVARAVADALARAGQGGRGKPVLACLLGMPGVLGGVGGEEGAPGPVPVYPTPEDAVHALAAAVRYARWRSRPAGPPEPAGPTDPTDPAGGAGAPGGARGAAAARDLVRGVLAGRGPHQGRVELDADQRAALLGCYGITVEPPDGPDGPGEHGDGRGDGTGRPPGEVEVVLRSHEDELFGPLVSLGVLGAPHLMGDVARSSPPLSALDAADLVRSLRAAPLLAGRPGAPGVDVAALEDLVVRLGLMADDVPSLASVVLDPVAVRRRGAVVRGARVEVATPAGGTEPSRRALHG